MVPKVSATTRVIGVMLVHDEWPLVAYSATHALVNHVDELWIIDHHSTDQLLDGMALLQGLFGDRLHLLRIGDVAFHQSAMVAWAIEKIAPRPNEWIYVVDADEFLLCAPGVSVRDILDELPVGLNTLRYDVANFIAPRDFELTSANELSRIEARSEPHVTQELSGSEIAERVKAEEMCFFDVPFRSKVISRRVDTWFLAGAHGVAGQRSTQEFHVESATLHAAHFVLLTRQRLEVRAKGGMRLRKAGFDANHGWQSHLLWELQQAGRLDDFWNRHSMGDGGPDFAVDSSLRISLAPMIAHLSPCDAALQSPPPLEHRAHIDATDDDLVSAFSALLHRVGYLIEQKNESVHELEDELIAVRGQVEELGREHHELTAQRKEILESTSWRLGRLITRVNLWALIRTKR